MTAVTNSRLAYPNKSGVPRGACPLDDRLSCVTISVFDGIVVAAGPVK